MFTGELFAGEQFFCEQYGGETVAKEKNRVGFEIRRLEHTMSKNLESWVKAEGIDEITLMHGWVMRYLYEKKEEDVFQRDIEKHFVIGRSTVTNILQMMEKRGLVSRESVASDARLKKVVLTQKGIESHEKIEAMISCLNEKMVVDISKEELDVFLRVADQIRANIENESMKPKQGKEEAHDSNIIEGSKRV